MEKLGFEESLRKQVVSTGKCVGCAACVMACPFGCLDYGDEAPKISGACKECGICLGVCPKYNWSWPALEEFVHGRRSEPEENFGIYRRLIVAQARDEATRHVGQDGGVVTSLLSFALDKGTIDGGAISGVSKRRDLASEKLMERILDSPDTERIPTDLARAILYYWQHDQLLTEIGVKRLLEASILLEPEGKSCPVPRLVTNSKEVRECAGTRYFHSPNLFAFWSGVTQKRNSIAFVGTPCQVHALRKIQMVPLKKFTKKLHLIIGLMCTESFTYHGLMKTHIQETMGINPDNIRKMNIKGKVLIALQNGATREIPLPKAKEFIRPSCAWCSDFSAELADISVGGLGLTGWSFVVVRTKKGEDFFQEALNAQVIRTRPIEKTERALDLLTRLSTKKRKRRS